MDGLCHFIATHILRNWTSIWTFSLLSDGNTINIRDAADSSDEVDKLCRFLPIYSTGLCLSFKSSRVRDMCLFSLFVRAGTSSCVFDGLCHFFSVDLDGRQSRTSFVSKLLDDAIIYWASLTEYCAGWRSCQYKYTGKTFSRKTFLPWASYWRRWYCNCMPGIVQDRAVRTYEMDQ